MSDTVHIRVDTETCPLNNAGDAWKVCRLLSS